MEKPVFALDVDGVLLDIVQGAIDYVEKKYGAHITEDDFTTWNWDYALSLPEGITPEFWMSVWNRRGVPYQGAHGFINELRRHYQVVAISCRPRHWEGINDAAYLAAKRDFAQFAFDDLYLVDSSKQKPEIMKELEARFIVEDNPINAAHCAHDSGAKAFLMTRPWNTRSISVTGAWERVGSYTEILGIVGEYELARIRGESR